MRDFSQATLYFAENFTLEVTVSSGSRTDLLSSIMVHGGCVYIMTNKNHTVFYTGVTSDLYARIVEHREKIYPSSFTSRYNITKLMYYESFYSIEEAIDREKQIKKYSRFKKVKLVNSQNPEWRDLFEDVSKW
jgi:putative endonuclease